MLPKLHPVKKHVITAGGSAPAVSLGCELVVIIYKDFSGIHDHHQTWGFPQIP